MLARALTLWRNVSSFRHAFRTLKKQPGPTMVVVLTLSLAIGASTVLYSAIDLVQHFLPIPKPDGLVYVSSTDTRVLQQGSAGRSVVLRTPASVPDLADWSSRNSTFEALAGFSIGSANLTGVDIPMRVQAIRMTANLTDLWGLTAEIGRSFRAGEDRAGAEQVTLLSHGFWERQFASDENVLGRTLLLDGRTHTIVGVLPRESGTGFFRAADVFLIQEVDALRAARDRREVFVTGRLKPGVTREQASADLEVIARQLRSEYPATNERIGAIVLPLVEASGFNIGTLMAILGLIALLVLVVAFANLGNVVVAQSLSRRHEFAVRSALGASRFDHVRQLMTESTILSIAAGGIGVVLAAWGVAGLRWFGGESGLAEIHMNPRIVVVGLLAAFAAPIGFALWPAARMPAPETLDLKEGARTVGTTRRSRRMRSLLVALQAAAAMVLMIQIGLLVRTVWTLSAIPSGFDPAQVLTFRVDLTGDRYARAGAIGQFETELTRRIGTLPGVASMGIVDALPVVDDDPQARLSVDGAAPAPLEARPLVGRIAIGGAYLPTMRIPVTRGRDFTASEISNASAVALVNEEAARRFWPGRDPIGARVALDAPPGREAWLQIVGVIGNVRNSDVDQGPQPAVYVSTAWRPSAALAVVVKSTTADPMPLVSAVRAQAAAIDRDHPIYQVATMSQILFNDLASSYVLSWMLTVVGLVALCLAAVGVYGTVSYLVAQRGREIGVRMALGARPAAMVRMVLAQSARPVIVGGLAGLVAAIAVALVLATAVPEMNVRDPLNYAGVIIVIGLTTFVAGYVPALRAASIDPVDALRAE
jgi:putative ABC transport system permease protein